MCTYTLFLKADRGVQVEIGDVSPVLCKPIQHLTDIPGGLNQEIQINLAIPENIAKVNQEFVFCR